MKERSKSSENSQKDQEDQNSGSKAPEDESSGGRSSDGDSQGSKKGHHAKMVESFKRKFWISLALTVPVLVLSPMLQELVGVSEQLSFTGDSYIQWAISTAIYFYGGWPFIKGAYDELAKKQPGMMILIGLAITVAYAYSSVVVFGVPGRVFFWELATLIDVMLLGHWIEMRSVMGASGALQELVELMPSQAHRLKDDGSTEDVSITDLEAGDKVVIKPGEKIPTDGTIVEGHTSVDESMLTGESKPVEKKEEGQVIGGAINGESAITVEVEKTGDETYLSQVVEMVRQAQESRSRTQDLANRAALWLTIIALSVGLATLAGWLIFGREFVFSLERMVTVMVITCPHALGLAVPLVVAVSTSLAAGKGLLIRNRSSFERARDLDAVVFDKTGTLTKGTFAVDQVVTLSDSDEEEVLRLAGAVESLSEHPIARGIVDHAEEKGLDLPKASEFQAIPGQGAEAEVEGRKIRCVGPGYLEENGISAEDERISSLAEEGKTVIYVLDGDEALGAVGLGDVVRPESKDAVRRLKEMGVQVMMLTGDSEAVAASVARELGLDDYFAEVLPDKKAEKIKEVKGRGHLVAMVGDGVNDAPALAEAGLGVAIGAGTDVAVQTADVVLVRSDPRDMVAITELARATHRKMIQNLWWATGYNFVAIPLAAGVLYPVGVLLPPAIGAMVMSASTVIVAINAKLLSRAGSKLKGGDERDKGED